MSGSHRQLLLSALKIADGAVMTGSFVLAKVPFLIDSENNSLMDFFSMRIKVQNFVLFCGFLLIWYLLFTWMGLYRSRRLVPHRTEALSVFKATSLGTLCVALATLLFSIKMADVAFLAIFWVTSSVAAISFRMLLRYVLEHARRGGYGARFVLIAGVNPRTIAFAQKLESSPEFGYRIVGFTDDPWHGLSSLGNAGYSLACHLQDLTAFIRSNVIDEMVIGLPIRSCYQQVSQVAALCEMQGIVVRFLPSISNFTVARSRVDEIEGDSLVTLYTGRFDGWSGIVKRILDVILASLAIVVLSPLLVITAILIKITSPGPVLFVQERLGLNKRRFRICKFRTMGIDAERRQAGVEHLNEVSGPVFKIKNDPRITPLGRYLRKSSIDELPQLFNVLKGDMSLVGPRPLPVRDYEGFDQDWHRRRFSVRPGITCLWQVHGRSSISFDSWMELDMRYIDEWSLWLDFRILAFTIPAVVKGDGAA